MKEIPENRKDCETILLDKFAKLSEYVDVLIKRAREPEQVSGVIKSMVDIYERLPRDNEGIDELI